MACACWVSCLNPTYASDFPSQQFITHGKTYQEAAENGQETLEELIAVFQDNGQPIPEPSAPQKTQAA